MGVVHRSVESDENRLAFGIGWNGKGLAIPTGAVKWQTAAPRVVLHIERALDRPIVREVQRSPPRIIKRNRIGTGCVSLVKLPAVVEGFSITFACFLGNDGRGGKNAVCEQDRTNREQEFTHGSLIVSLYGFGEAAFHRAAFFLTPCRTAISFFVLRVPEMRWSFNFS